MVAAIAAFTVLMLAAGLSPAAGQARLDLSRLRVLAIAPFADDVALSRHVADYGASRLSELVAGRAFQAVPASRVADEMRRLGIGARELISPTKTWMLGQALGADAVVAARVIHFMQDREPSREDGFLGGGGTRVDVDIRVLDVRTRVNVFQNTFICQRPLPSFAAMECVVRDVAAVFGTAPP